MRKNISSRKSFSLSFFAEEERERKSEEENKANVGEQRVEEKMFSD